MNTLNRPRFVRPKTLALAISLACVATANAQSTAQSNNADSEDDSSKIEIIEVFGQSDAQYKARVSGDLRRVAELIDTPQTITVLTQTQMLDSGKTDLKDILSSQAGITLGTGENGNAFGDRYVIRGHEARSDVYVDGVRDPGMTTRESFATEQIEITKGPSSTFAGRGSTGGAVNGITKQASHDFDFSILNTQLGTDDHHRVTLDTNQQLNDQVALRLNLLDSEEDVPDRAPAGKERTGGLLSVLYEATPKLSVVADIYALDADDVPDLGSYFNQATRKPVKDIPVYSQKNSDFLSTSVRTFTLKETYAFTDNFRVQNSTRYGETENGYVTTGTRGATRAAGDPVAPGAATISFSSHQGWQEVEYFVNQTNFFLDLQQGSLEHKTVFGVEYTDEAVLNGVYTLANTGATNCRLAAANNPAGTAGYCGLDGSGNAVPNINTLLGRTVVRGAFDTDYGIETVSVFAMDTIEFNEQWSGFFGLRHDSFEYSNNVRGGGANPTSTLYDYSDSFWNGHMGVVRALGDSGNLYATFSTSTNINGGESDVGGSCGYGGLCGTPDQVGDSDPESMENLELGVKWNFFDDTLMATAALFQMTKDDIHESVGNAYSNLGTLNTGKNRVKGVEFSLAGNLTDKLSTQLSAAFMESEVREAFLPEQIGLALSNFADDSIYWQLRYQATDALSFGGTVSYQSEMYGGQPDTAAGFNVAINDYSIVVPSYEVLDLFLNYEHSDQLALHVNVGNVLDKEYWTAAYRSGSFMYLGTRQNLRASVTYGF
ncbi:MAG: TonB-dependent receptor [Pseudomonadota bacterium]